MPDALVVRHRDISLSSTIAGSPHARRAQRQDPADRAVIARAIERQLDEVWKRQPISQFRRR